MGTAITLAKAPELATTTGARYPIGRIFCIGKNYAAHAVEMGMPATTPPVFFMKPATSFAPGGSALAYPDGTEDLHYEGELVVALKAGGTNLSETEAEQCLYGFAAGCDLTKRDLQAAAKKKGGPWEAAKAFDHSAVIAPLTPTDALAQNLLEDTQATLTTRVNGSERQSSLLAAMTWSVPAIIAELSRHFTLLPGDLIFTGTPEGVGALTRGDTVTVQISGLEELRFSLTD